MKDDIAAGRIVVVVRIDRETVEPQQLHLAAVNVAKHVDGRTVIVSRATMFDPKNQSADSDVLHGTAL